MRNVKSFPPLHISSERASTLSQALRTPEGSPKLLKRLFCCRSVKNICGIVAAFIKNVNQYQFFLLQKCLNLAFVFKLIPAIISDPEEKKLYLKKINNNKSNNKNIMYIYLTMILVFFPTRMLLFCQKKVTFRTTFN